MHLQGRGGESEYIYAFIKCNTSDKGARRLLGLALAALQPHVGLVGLGQHFGLGQPKLKDVIILHLQGGGESEYNVNTSDKGARRARALSKRSWVAAAARRSSSSVSARLFTMSIATQSLFDSMVARAAASRSSASSARLSMKSRSHLTLSHSAWSCTISRHAYLRPLVKPSTRIFFRKAAFCFGVLQSASGSTFLQWGSGERDGGMVRCDQASAGNPRAPACTVVHALPGDIGCSGGMGRLRILRSFFSTILIVG